MKRIVVFILAAVFVFLCMACTGKPHDADGTTMTQQQQENLPLNAKMVYFNKVETTNTYFSRIYNDCFIGTYSPPMASDATQLPNSHDYKIYNAKTGETKGSGGILNTSVGSKVDIFLDSRYYFEFWGQYDQDDILDEYVSFVKVDTESLVTEVVHSRPGISPLITAGALNEDEFVFCTTLRNDDGSVHTTIEKFNIRNNKCTVLAEGSYLNLPENEESIGTLYEAVAACDNKIYVLGRKRSGSAYIFNLYIMDADGNLLSTIESGELGSLASIIKFSVINDYLIISTMALALTDVLFKLEDGKLTNILNFDDQISFAGGLQDFCDSSTVPYIYYRHQHNDKPVIYGLNTKTGEVKGIDVKFDDEYDFLYYFCMDVNGNLMLIFITEALESGIEKIYKVNSADLIAEMN